MDGSKFEIRNPKSETHSPQRHKEHKGQGTLFFCVSLCSLCLCGEFQFSNFAFVSDFELPISDFNDLRDITGIEDHSLPARALWPYAWGLGIVLLMSLFLVGWRYYRRNPDRTEVRAGSWALAELERIELLGRSSNMADLERYPTLLSEVIRLYLEKRFQLRAPRQTTPEFFHDVEHSTVLSPPQQQLLREFLEHCDLSKFAHIQFSIEEYRALEQAARKFVEQTAE
jgi:hypothetical protein